MVTRMDTAEVFKDPHAISIFDEEHSQREDRWITIGSDYNARMIVVSHTFRRIDECSFRTRIISSKKAAKNERKQYGE